MRTYIADNGLINILYENTTQLLQNSTDAVMESASIVASFQQFKDTLLTLDDRVQIQLVYALQLSEQVAAILQ